MKINVSTITQQHTELCGNITAFRQMVALQPIFVWPPICLDYSVHVPKCSGAEISRAEMSKAPKIPSAKMSRCRKVLVSKCPWRRNVHVPVRPQGRNMHVPKCPGDEMSILKCLLPKCQVPKQWEAVLMATFTLRYHLTGQFLWAPKNLRTLKQWLLSLHLLLTKSLCDFFSILAFFLVYECTLIETMK